MNSKIIVYSNFLIILLWFYYWRATISVERVGVSFEPELLKKFDILINKGYTNRSKYIRDLVRKEIIASEIKEEESKVIGTFTIIYGHDIGNVTAKLLHFQHYHLEEIIFTTHIHVNNHTYPELVVIFGQLSRLKKFAESVKLLKGVQYRS